MQVGSLRKGSILILTGDGNTTSGALTINLQVTCLAIHWMEHKSTHENQRGTDLRILVFFSSLIHTQKQNTLYMFQRSGSMQESCSEERPCAHVNWQWSKVRTFWRKKVYVHRKIHPHNPTPKPHLRISWNPSTPWSPLECLYDMCLGYDIMGMVRSDVIQNCKNRGKSGQVRLCIGVDSGQGRSEDHSQSSESGSGQLPESSCSTVHALSSAPWLIPRQSCVGVCLHASQYRSIHSLCKLYTCAQSFLSSQLLLFSPLYFYSQSAYTIFGSQGGSS